jgi:hypothetical protein
LRGDNTEHGDDTNRHRGEQGQAGDTAIGNVQRRPSWGGEIPWQVDGLEEPDPATGGRGPTMPAEPESAMNVG